MSAEAEAGEILVRILGQGISEMIRLSGQTTMLAGRAAVSLMTFCYAAKVGGSPAEIARNPAGMAIITIPEDRLEDFRMAAKAYKLKFFSVNSKDYDRGYLDLCMKAEDVATCQRILEMTGIAAVQATGTTVLDQQAMAVRGSQTFEEASEKLKASAQSIEECFNRITDNDFARDEPYVICDRMHPKNYVRVHPAQDMFNGEAYTKSTYTTYKNGNETGMFDDGRFEGRKKDHWFKTRTAIVSAAGLTDNHDLIYFRTAADHQAYVQLAEGRKPEAVVQVNADGSLQEIAENIKANIESAGVSKQVPADAQRAASQIAASVNGQESGAKGQKNTTTTKMIDPEKEKDVPQITFEEASKKLQEQTQSIEKCFNRHTEKDYARNQPYVVCDRMHPENYVLVHPQKDVYNEMEYTKSTYTTFEKEVQTGIFDDGRFKGRPRDYWFDVRKSIAEAAGLQESNDMVYFRTVADHQAYLQLSKSKVPEATVQIHGNFQTMESQTVASVNGQESEVKEQKSTTTTKMIDLEKGKVSPQITFEEKAERLRNRSQTFDASLNRRTEKDFSRNEPYAVCDRKNPMSFIALKPKQATYEGETYTRTTYQVYRNGELAGTFDDGRSTHRDPYYWGQLKDKMQSAGGFENDMIYFKDLASLKAYQDLYSKSQAAPEIAKGIDSLATSVLRDVNDLQQPAADQKKAPAGEDRKPPLPAGGKKGYSEGGVREFAAQYKESHPAPDPELTKAIREKMAEMGMQR